MSADPAAAGRRPYLSSPGAAFANATACQGSGRSTLRVERLL